MSSHHNCSHDHDHSHDHGHSHGHDHGHGHGHGRDSQGEESGDVNRPKIPSGVDLEGDNVSIQTLVTSIRYGMKAQVQAILDLRPEFANTLDAQGYSCAHWAAKRGDVELLRIIFEHGGRLNIAAESDARMLPIHWAASDGKLGAIRFLLEKRMDINAQDGNGCTPVVIATQHNQVTCVVFLVKNGADMTLRDCNGDNALHWAAYKGHVEAAGFLTYCMPHDIDTEDTYGQTALHLAALRGNVDLVEYLIIECGADTTKKDRNGLSPLELAVKKSQFKCEWSLRRLTTSSVFGLIRGLPIDRLKDGKVLGYLTCGSNDKEVSVWPWRIVFFSNLFASLSSMYFASEILLVDLYLLHLFNTMVQIMWWFCFTMCLFKSPSMVRDVESTSPSAVTYANALDVISKSDYDEGHQPALCHSCHVCKPIRSKHCKVQRRCVHKFDHFCPFVGNTVGRDNYKYFVGLLCAHVLCASGWEVCAFFLWWRTRISWGLMVYMVYALLWLAMICFLLQYHIQLITQNLTTNEHINLNKYAYLKNSFNLLDNPFDKGSAYANIVDGLFPSSKVFYSRDEVVGDRRRVKPSNDGDADQKQGLLTSSPDEFSKV